jgi:UDP-N-acetylmuramoyl-L-alanyl-D-glutamate--2,6-diaminopimelate ligase
MLIEQMLRDCGMRTGLMGTVGTKIGDGWFEAERTTMDAVDLQMNLRRMADIGTDFCVMEVSSHALELGRVKGCRFRTALFTNLTQDHLDFHVTMERYKAAKGLLFARLGNEFEADPDKRRYAVLNKDDPASDDFSRMTSAEVVTYGFGDGADVRASGVSVTPKGTRFSCSAFGRQIDVAMKLIGKFNVSNALAALSAVLLEGVPLERAARALESAAGAPGRMEMVDEGQPFLVVVDYAHTPDGLENALATIREFARGRVITVFGCGGERDRTKRPLMGGIAARLSDIVVVTSDNPRSEPEEVIIDDIESGIPEEKRDPSRYARIADRKAAIKRAIEWASEDDVVLIAGKGHETYQVIGGVNIPFDDREVAKEAIRGIRP